MATPHKTRLPPGEANFNALFRDYQKKARLRNLPWNLTKAEFRKITQKNCFYCGDRPANVAGVSRPRNNGTYTYNGLDRAENDRGYSMGNCRACCKWCNIMKRDKSVMEFKTHIKKIIAKLDV